VLGDEAVARLAHHWEEGWNGRDLALIMEPLAPDVVFSSPFVPAQLDDPTRTTVEGKETLRSYVAAALERSGDVRYSLQGAYAGVDTVVLVYTCHLPGGVDRPGADLMRLGPEGTVVEGRSHYDSDPAAWRAR